MTLASCALEGTAARFQNSSPRAAPRGGDRPPPSGAAPGPSRPATRVRRSTNLLAAAFQSNSLGWHRAGARDKKHGEGDNARTCRAARSSALALCSPGPHPARADRRKSWGPRARPQTQGRPPRPAPRSRALRFSLRSKLGGRELLASPVLGCRGEGERTSPPNSRAPSSLPVGTRAKNRPRRREKGEKGKEKGDEGGERGLGVRPALGPPRPKRPALSARLGRL